MSIPENIGKITVVRQRAVLLSLALCLALSCLFPVVPKKAEAANFQMQTGSYTGTGAALTISGLGFTPNMVMIKSATAAGVAVFRTSAMGATVTAFTSATADNTGTNISFASGSFTLGTLANVNTANVLYYWTAFTGSDCSATGNFCVGTYTGNGTNPRTITTGFQPSYVMVKRSTAVSGNFRVAAEPANESLFFDTTARDTVGNYIQSFAATGFVVGTTDNTNTGVYYYVAFKATSGLMAQGTYTGNATDSTNITAGDFVPNLAMIKNATSATAANRNPQMNFSESYGDNSSYVGAATANQVNAIQTLQSNGFQIGTAVQVNESAATFYWVTFGGASNYSASGTFQMKTGSYTGTGASLPVTGVGFTPDLVIIKDNAANYAVFRSEPMAGDTTAYLANAVANFTGGITSLDAGGFTVGTSTVTNTTSNTYHWQAFGNAFDPYDNSGASDFAVGAYYGNGIDSRNITRLPWQPNLVATKRNGASAGMWRTSALAGDLSSAFAASAEAADHVQALNSDGFQIGTNASSNAAANMYYWFAFKNGANFAVGSYTGTGSAQTITSPALPPDLTWIKRSTAVNGVVRGASLTGNNTQYFANTANVSDRITSQNVNGFSVGGSQTETNTNAGTYRYATWRVPGSGTLWSNIVDAAGADVASPSISMSALNLSFACSTSTGTLGTSSQRARVQNTTANPAWTLTIAATSGNTAAWTSGGDNYDFNDGGGSPAGCGDGLDTDGHAGQLTLNPAAATIAPATGCASTGLSLGSSAAFAEATTDSVTLATASASAGVNCYWDITGMGVSQKVPAEKPVGTYSLSLTITMTAN